jgi:hypothetical protein
MWLNDLLTKMLAGHKVRMLTFRNSEFLYETSFDQYAVISRMNVS